MKRVFGLAVSAGLVFAATAANAQMSAPYRAVSDFDGPYERPYGAVPPAPPPVYNYGSNYGQPPGLMPMPEVYAVLRDNGFSPLGVPHQRGFVYTVAVIDRNGEDGRLVIDGRNGRIIRFVPAYGPAFGPGWGPGGGPGWGRGPGSPYDESFNAVPGPGYGPQGALPPPTVIRGVPRPPATVPHVASRAVPLPAPKPAVAVRPEPAPQQSAAVEPKPAPAASAPPAPAASAPAASTQTAQTNAPPPVAAAKPAPVIQPTQQMPAAQGLE